MSELKDQIEDLIDDYLIKHQGKDAQLSYTDQLAGDILTLLPSQTTSLEEVGEIVREIDAAYEKAGWDGEQFDENCIRRPEDFNLTAPRVMEELNSMRLLVNGWPAIRTALADTGWREFKDFNQISENTPYEITDGKNHWFAMKAWFEDEIGGGWLFQPCLRNGDDDWSEDEPIFNSDGRNSITHFKPIDPLPEPPLTREEG